MQRILIDYLTLSVSMKIFSVDDVCRKIGIVRDDYTKIKSRYGYPNCLYYGGIKIHYHNDTGEIEKPLIVIEMSGQGCRLVETVKQTESLDWIVFIEQFLKEEGSHLARLDVACDDKVEQEGEKPLLSFLLMVKHLKERRYICQANRKIYTDGDEQNIVFGAPSSDRRLRIYNKQLERNYDKHWIRAEFQLRNEAALSFYMRALERNDIGGTYYGILYAYLRFTKEVNEVNHTERCTVTRWWDRFCNGAQKIKGFYLGGCEYNLQNVHRFLSVQAASTVQTFMHLTDGDFDKLFGLMDGAKLNKRQEWLVKVERLKREIELSYDERYREQKEIEKEYDLL